MRNLYKYYAHPYVMYLLEKKQNWRSTCIILKAAIHNQATDDLNYM